MTPFQTGCPAWPWSLSLLSVSLWLLPPQENLPFPSHTLRTTQEAEEPAPFLFLRDA